MTDVVAEVTETTVTETKKAKPIKPTVKPVKTAEAKTEAKPKAKPAAKVKAEAKPKTPKAPKSAEAKVRLPAAEQMANRTRVSFGSAFIRDCKAGVQKDEQKVILFASAIGVEKLGRLKTMKFETVVEKLKEHLASLPADHEFPKNAKFE